MCGQDSIYSTTTNPSNSNQINAMSSSLVAGSGFLTDRQVHIFLTGNNKHSLSQKYYCFTKYNFYILFFYFFLNVSYDLKLYKI